MNEFFISYILIRHWLVQLKKNLHYLWIQSLRNKTTVIFFYSIYTAFKTKWSVKCANFGKLFQGRRGRVSTKKWGMAHWTTSKRLTHFNFCVRCVLRFLSRNQQQKNHLLFRRISFRSKKCGAYEMNTAVESRQKKKTKTTRRNCCWYLCSSRIWLIILPLQEYAVSKRDDVNEMNERTNIKWNYYGRLVPFGTVAIYQLLFWLHDYRPKYKKNANTHKCIQTQRQEVETVLQCNYYRTNSNKCEQ